MSEERFPLVVATRWLAPLAVALGLVGAVVAGGSRPRAVLLGGAAVVAALALAARLRRPVLVVDDEGYRVEGPGGRERLRVAFAEVKRVRAVPGELAMYLDCGDPPRNLLLPTRHGFGFRFHRQGALYPLLARKLADRIEIVEKLIP